MILTHVASSYCIILHHSAISCTGHFDSLHHAKRCTGQCLAICAHANTIRNYAGFDLALLAMVPKPPLQISYYFGIYLFYFTPRARVFLICDACVLPTHPLGVALLFVIGNTDPQPTTKLQLQWTFPQITHSTCCNYLKINKYFCPFHT